MSSLPTPKTSIPSSFAVRISYEPVGSRSHRACLLLVTWYDDPVSAENTRELAVQGREFARVSFDVALKSSDN